MEKKYNKVLILGGTGFLGYYVLGSLDKADFDMAIMLHRKKDDLNIPFEGYSVFEGDVLKPETLKEAMDKFKPDVVINMVGSFKADPKRIFVDSIKNVVSVSQEAGVKKIIYISDLMARSDKSNAYLNARREAEKELQKSALDWTIFRPTTLFGWRANFTNVLKKQIEGIYPVLIPASKYKLQPMAAQSLAESITAASFGDLGNFKIYEAVGPQTLTPKDIAGRLKLSLNSDRKILVVPIFILKLFSFLKKIGFPTHISSSYVYVFQNKVLGDPEELQKDFNIKQIKFDPAEDHLLY